ncbi:AAA-domain-containing protein [Rhizodiscina lignyota]|uniref:Peroxisomal ATPase PEX1 n=1 Tax=Rhizodiscina lignyota TaxID=1504668 RepID=A0A9P4I309_9PEZI|nr:AAA-domain-containing protein [Rhizodiscina lignyota]
MAPAPRKSGGQTVQAEVSLLSLKNCLVNLPASLVALLINANTVAQNVAVELQWRQPVPPSSDTDKPTSVLKSIFVGWTGMQSKTKIAPVVGRDGITGGRDQDIAQLEIDATFARLLGLNNGQKVGLLLHMDPPQAHTVNIEPLTPADWEMIELHAKFLELNFLSQVRALPNPGYTPTADGPKQTPHPLTLHLSPTSTANIVVTSLTPAPPSSTPFVKISPDAEVIVAPKTRERSEKGSGRASRSVASTGRRSAGGKSGASTVRNRSRGNDGASKGVMFLRGVDRAFCNDYFDDEEGSENEGLTVWVDKELLLTRALKGATWISVAVVKPAGLIEPTDPSKEQDAEKPASKLVAKLKAWEEGPDTNHVALSSMLCRTLASPDMVGGLVRLEAAPPQLSKTTCTSGSQSSKDLKKRFIKVFPFPSPSGAQSAGLKFGGESKQEKEESVQRLRSLFCKDSDGNGLLDGPLTDGMLLPASDDDKDGWYGGIIRFEPSSVQPGQENSKTPPNWIIGSEWRPAIEVQPEVAPPSTFLKGWSPGEQLPKDTPVMVGIDSLIEELSSDLMHSSSVLLTGGLGAGKTKLSHLLAHQLRDEEFYHTVYFSCRSLATNETRASTIKETLNRVFGSAVWGARLGGKAVVILDDLDRLCPAETELQVGDENGRSRQISESLCSIVRQYCTVESGVVLLATAQSKEAVNNVITGGHVVREIVSLKAPNKDGRRRVLEMLVQQNSAPSRPLPDTNGTFQPSHSRNVSTSSSRPGTAGTGAISHDGFVVDKHIDFLDIAGQTDGYMPGDLVLLVSRARSEALIRTLTSTTSSSSPFPSQPESSSISLTRADFTAALKGFTPASLRNVTLQHSTTRWSSIGGLHSTRLALLETLQYPTTYAPIFAACPLRLRSGLLLYGYPGCGKTLLASAVAGECGLNFISVKGPEILNKYIGASEKSVRDLFERAQAARPCVLFFDEFDSIAPKRGHDSTGVTDRVVNQLLTQMDGAEGLSGVYVLAATSRPDLIDPALLRPGRLDKSLVCEMPDVDERADILKAVGSKVRFSEEVRETGLLEVARRTEGYSGADLQAVVYNAQLEAIHDVLGDDDAGELKPKVNGTENGTVPGSRNAPDFIHFRYGDKEEEDGDENASSAALTERAKIAAQLASMQALRKKEKQAQQQRVQAQHRPSSSYLNRPSSAYGIVPHHDENAVEDKESDSKEPIIQWRHIQKSLETTRASISPDERKRLARIYREFVEGRTGELPNGQGGTEIGGRASLM